MKRAIFFFLLLNSAAVHAMTGNEILANLKASDAFSNMAAYAYIRGVADTEALNRFTALTTISADEYREVAHKYICVPDGVNGSQIFDVVRLYLENNPKFRHQVGAISVKIALHQAWQCAN